MSGEINLDVLLKTMRPDRVPGEYVFCIVERRYDQPAGISPILTFREEEGLALILTREDADAAGLPYEYVAAMITLTVHSSLDAVGFLAAITQKLAAVGISVNPVSAYYHDHLFVPVDKADQAMSLLKEFCA